MPAATEEAKTQETEAKADDTKAEARRPADAAQAAQNGNGNGAEAGDEPRKRSGLDERERVAIGKRIRKFREAKGMSRKALVESFERPGGGHFTPNYLVLVEKGAQAPSAEVIDGAAAILEVKPEEILGSTDRAKLHSANEARRGRPGRSATRLQARRAVATAEGQTLKMTGEAEVRLVPGVRITTMDDGMIHVETESVDFIGNVA